MRKNNNKVISLKFQNEDKVYFIRESFKVSSQLGMNNKISSIEYEDSEKKKDFILFLVSDGKISCFTKMSTDHVKQYRVQLPLDNSYINPENIIKNQIGFHKESHNLFSVITCKKTIFFAFLDKAQRDKIDCIFNIGSKKGIDIISSFLDSTYTYLYVLLSKNIIIKLDYSKSTENNQEILQTLLATSSNFPYVNVKYNYKGGITIENKIYSMYDEDKTNIKNVFVFDNGNDEDHIVILSVYNEAYMAIGLLHGTIYLLSMKNKPNKISSIYKTNFGQPYCFDWGGDGELLSISCQDNNAYIIHTYTGEILLCLTSHSNYISRTIFVQQEITLYKNQSNSSKGGFNEFEKGIILNDWAKINRHMRHSSMKNINGRKSNIIKTHKEMKIFDIYTCGLDGWINSYNIEFEVINDKDIIYDDSDESEVEYKYPLPLELREPNEGHYKDNNAIPIILPERKNEVINEPIIYFNVFDNFIIGVGKENYLSTELNVFYYERGNK